MIKILPIASGSSGNSCLYISDKAKILIDAGSNTKTIRLAMAREGLELSDITHIFITHTHKDHISALPVLLKHSTAPLYISETAVNDLEVGNDRAVTFKVGDKIQALEVCVSNFHTPHDSLGSVGYVLENSKNKFAYCTDLGYVTDEIKEAIHKADTLYIESNHDIDMLKQGAYPYFLKKRILSEHGHISNAECAKLVAEKAKFGAKNIILAHLSEENNTPSKALYETENALYRMGADEQIRVFVAPKKNDGKSILVG